MCVCVMCVIKKNIILIETKSNNYLSLWIAIIILSGAIIIYIIMHRAYNAYKGFIEYI